ncbi:hypothetical protein ACOTWK_00855 [Aliarcobacter butzleri]|uniref:hypothetical protein n=1 Tax=Aliarcobacter butzleri TaxID=28197 RepID=UPI001EDB1A80|nr:hypothetical protein [Aliarcobacter butzleri]MCG3655272.1 hypothetical protein [Aliarcobacter butzleri]MCG3717669.1 hypothetical protein [Aliarcobacter butzleri]MCT7614053.1 hypothetical protein [Aliarcobacter butzleri]MDK2049990.1 hypothetical protein [Aliarcobacter butzleri]
MQLEIIYVNKSTILAVDYKMKEEINKIINYSLIHNELNKLNQLNIFFVSEAELYSDIIKRDKHTYRIEDLSLFDSNFLGVYIEKSDELNGQILIKICPEKILHSAFVLKEKWNLEESNLNIYKTLLGHVILKQLGHYALTQSDFNEYPFASMILENLDSYDESCLNMLYNANYSDISHIYYKNYEIEYSLVNRFSLEHNWSQKEKNIIWKFIESQYDGKSSIISWRETSNFIDTFESWKKVKNSTTLKEYLKFFDKNEKIFDSITDKFKNNENINSCNFETIYIEHMENVVNTRELCNLNPDLLTSFNGVYQTLIKYFSKNNNSKKVLKYCEHYLTKIDTTNYTAYTKTYVIMADAIKNDNPKKSREYLNLSLSYAKDTFPEFKEGYEETIYKKLQELG